MAHVENNVGAYQHLKGGYYNVTEAVGPVGTAPNHRDDVLLVQYLLKAIATGSPRPMVGNWAPPGGAGSLVVDGRMGAVTAAWIRSYQKTCKLLYVDDRIDPARGEFGSLSGMAYTIVVLNLDFSAVQPAKFRALEDAADAPADLRDVIRKTRAQGIISIYPTANTL